MNENFKKVMNNKKDMVIKLSDLMILERLLLEIDIRFKFKLSFNDAFTLYECLRDVGRFTNYAFSLQDEFHMKYDDAEELRKYHDKLMRSYVNFDYSGTTSLIDFVASHFGDEDFMEILEKNKFWS